MTSLTDLPLFRSTPSLFPSFSKSSQKVYIRGPVKVRCSIAEDSRVSSPKFNSNLEGRDSATADCVVVGGGISGLCIAQALSTKHRDVAPNVIVTEAKHRVGGNIITVEKDGYLWEEGPNSFQPSDPMLSMVVRFKFTNYSLSLILLRILYIPNIYGLLQFNSRWWLRFFSSRVI